MKVFIMFIVYTHIRFASRPLNVYIIRYTIAQIICRRGRYGFLNIAAY